MASIPTSTSTNLTPIEMISCRSIPNQLQPSTPGQHIYSLSLPESSSAILSASIDSVYIGSSLSSPSPSSRSLSLSEASSSSESRGSESPLDWNAAVSECQSTCQKHRSVTESSSITAPSISSWTAYAVSTFQPSTPYTETEGPSPSAARLMCWCLTEEEYRNTAEVDMGCCQSDSLSISSSSSSNQENLCTQSTGGAVVYALVQVINKVGFTEPNLFVNS
jgi:hypothetical protein